jgi:predicted NACHT family NTPase
VLKVVSNQNNGRLVLLGDPGAGKSTLAVYLMLALCDLAVGKEATNDASGGDPLASLRGCLPILLELRAYAPDPHAPLRPFLDEIEQPLKPGHPGMPRRVLEPYLQQGGRALVIFDGLAVLG